MSVELTFTAQDVAGTRFAISPLWEVVASVRVLKEPVGLNRPWAEQVRGRLAGVDWRLLSDLVPVPTISLLCFLAPPPATSLPDLELELAGMLATEGNVRAELDAWKDHPRTRRMDALYADPAAGLARLADEIRAYWQAAIEPYWPRVRSLLEGDLLYRARLLAEGGVRAMLADLDDKVTWQGERLSLEHRLCRGVRPLDGRGLLLVPSVFTWPRIFSITVPPFQPTLRYAPRGIGTLWERSTVDAPQALAAVLGRTRARLLAALDQPASTRDLALRAGLSEPGANQHLTALRKAGLCSAHRTGRYVLYARTAVAEALLAGHSHT
ncbi:winged helix-turn-helix domain-containing protein [Nonomuraea sp. NBC_01738]|uniref:ArsR/SmtB family transcription factor n=1 Tax=Nonomuraea sp. NBC_01738 TaxID=2976003 RepID=UPI002E128ABA|nr:winged helix-turn-helix domain-containing protein [Nonomuraea sp. NBC_01738]